MGDLQIRDAPQKSKSIGEILQGLILIWEVLDSEEIKNHLEYL